MPDPRQSLVDACRMLVGVNMNRGASGNVSVRQGDGLLVTPSGVAAEGMRPGQIVSMDMEGAWAGDWKPSSEWRIHRDIYRARPEIGAVVHCHSPAATALACLGRGIPPFHYMIAIAGGHDVRCAAYATVASQELSDAALVALAGRRACLLAHHGMIAIGADLGSALAVAEEIEHLADVYLRLLPLGEPPRIDAAEMDRVLALFQTYGANAQKGGKE